MRKRGGRKKVKKEPEKKYGYMPIWCHHHGSRMAVKELDLKKLLLVIASSTAEVRIEGSEVNGFKIQFNIVFSRGYGVVGIVYMKIGDLLSAFGLQDEIGIYGQGLLDNYGGDCANQGKYIRYKDFLNIPGPGTGHDGDPNISIHLDDEIKDAVQKLLNAKFVKKFTCHRCKKEGQVDEKDNFICEYCGHHQHVFYRKELMDLDDPKEGEMAIEIADISLGGKRAKN